MTPGDSVPQARGVISAASEAPGGGAPLDRAATMRACSSARSPMSALRTLALAVAAMFAVGAAGATTLSTGKPADPSGNAPGLATRDQLRTLKEKLFGMATGELPGIPRQPPAQQPRATTRKRAAGR